MRRLALLSLLSIAIACSRETPAPPQPSAPSPAATPQPTATATSVPQIDKGSYDEALLWMRSVPSFHFVLRDAEVQAEGEMTRKTPGTERVQVRNGAEEWLAQTTPNGVTWQRRKGGSWTAADAPSWGSRVYQRVTLVFDPQKKEGVPMLSGTEGDANVYKFTDANTGAAHEVWVNKADAHIERLKIGDKVDLKIIVP